MALRTFKPIAGLVVPTSAGGTLFYTSPAASTVVTSLRITSAPGNASAVLKIWRKPQAASLPLVDSQLIYARTIAPDISIEIRNLSLALGDTLYALVDAVGPVLSGSVSEGA